MMGVIEETDPGFLDPRSQFTLLRHQNKPVPGWEKTYGIFGLFLILFVLLKNQNFYMRMNVGTDQIFFWLCNASTSCWWINHMSTII